MVFRLNADHLHLTADDRLRAREARRYLALYEARRPEAARTADEAAAVRRFRGELEALEAWLSGPGDRALGAAPAAWETPVHAGPAGSHGPGCRPGAAAGPALWG